MMPKEITTVVDGVRITARVARDPRGRIVAAWCTATGEPVPTLVDPNGDALAALRAALAR
jgi:hypothetical protein